ncbi:MAG: TRAP transporter substrate-binding protein [Treponema sp.]|nr:TRAP transporter substrate-binding protein [Treponema sp.]
MNLNLYAVADSEINLEIYRPIKSLSRDLQYEDKKPVDTIIKECELSLCFSTALDDPRGEASLLFKAIVEEKTFGRIKVKLYPDEKKGSDIECIEKLIKNEIDMTISSAGNYSTFVTQAGYSAMPFLFSDFASAWQFIDSPKNQVINSYFEDYNMVVLAYFDNGFRCVTTSSQVGPINSVKDMKDVVIRTSSNQIVMETMYQLGAIPKSYSFKQLKDALKEGLFQAQENPIPVIYNSAIYEVQKYLAVTNHSYDAMPVTIRKSIWLRLTPEDREIILYAAEQAQALNRKLIKKQTESYLDELKEKGMIITYPDLSVFKEATKEVFNVFAPVYGSELLEELKEN